MNKVNVTRQARASKSPFSAGLLFQRSAKTAGKSTEVTSANTGHVPSRFDKPETSAQRHEIEQHFGYDFSQVPVRHTESVNEQSRPDRNIHAVTTGRNVLFNSAPYAPKSPAEKLANVILRGEQRLSKPKNLATTNPSGDTEQETHCNNLEVVANQADAGAAVDAGAPVGPRDAGPIAGAPSPAPSPPTPTPAPAAPSATIGAVTYRGSSNRIAPTRNAIVPVTLSGLPAGGSAAIDVEGSGGVNGTATITAGAALAASGNVTVRGDTQTTPGNAGNLRLRATVGSTVIGRSTGFTVAAWPADFTTSRNGDIDSGGAVGVVAQNAWISDGSGLAELNEVERTERVDIGSRDNPPFTSGSGTSATAGTSGFIAGTASPTTDRHSYGRASINTSTVVPGTYTLVYRQNFLFNDRRTGVTNAVVQNSGFTITHRVVVLDLPIVGRLSSHQTVKSGASVTVEGRATTAGSGTATSDVHTL